MVLKNATSTNITAASVWMVAAIGVAVGVVFLGESLTATAWIGLGCVVGWYGIGGEQRGLVVMMLMAVDQGRGYRMSIAGGKTGGE